MQSLTLRAALAAAAFAAGSSASGLPSFEPAALAVLPPQPQELWVEATPLDRPDPAQVFTLADGTRSLRLEGVRGVTMLCIGGKDRATRCERRAVGAGDHLVLDAPAPGVAVHGRLLVGKNPLRGAKLAVLPERLAARRPFSLPLFHAGGHITRQVQSDEKGAFSFAALCPGRYVLEVLSLDGRIDESGPFTVPEPARPRQKGQPAAPGRPVLDLGDVVLDEGVEVQVEAVTLDGEPLAGAGIGLLQEGFDRAPLFFEAKTRANGIAIVSRVDPSLPLLLTCAAPGYVRWQHSFERPPLAARCSLGRTVGIRGKVLDEEDAGVGGATVTLRGASRAVDTEGDGSFALDGVPPGEYELVAAAPGFRAAMLPVSLSRDEGHAEVSIELRAAGPLTGRIVEDSPESPPVQGAQVTVVAPPGGGSAVADEEGAFELRAGSDETMQLEVRAAGFAAETIEVPPDLDPAKALVVKLKRGGYIRVAVWDEESDSFCLGCSVSLARAGQPSPGILLTDAKGEAVSPPLSPGSWQVYLETVRSSGSAVTVRGGDNVRLASVESGQTTLVRFGERRLRVEVFFSPAPPLGWSLRATAPQGTATVSQEPDGSFVVRKLAGEALVLELTDAAGRSVRQALLPADFDASVLRLPLHGTEVRGSLLRGGEPLGSVAIRLVPLKDATLGAFAWTDEQGSFTVPFLLPGTYQLAVGAQPLTVVQVEDGGVLDLGAVPVK